MLTNETAINFISQKMESLPLSDRSYFGFDTSKISDIFCLNVKCEVTKSTSCVRRRRHQKHTHDNNYYDVFFFDKITSEVRKGDVPVHQFDNPFSKPICTPNLNFDCNKSLDETSNAVTSHKDIKKPKKSETCSGETPERNESVSPAFSDILPCQPRKRSPSKRKRSMEIFNFDEPCSVTKSCDLEVSNVFTTDFRSIQRALSFDEQLLRNGNELESIYHKNKFTRKLFSRPSVSIERMSCRSQPSTWEEPKGRKVQVLQVQPKEINEDSCNKSRVKLNVSSMKRNEEHIFQPIEFAPDKKL